MSALAQHRFSVEEYYRMAETGVLDSDARVELLDGQIIDMSPIGPFHGSVTNTLVELFQDAAKKRWFTWSQTPVRLNDHAEPQPDVMLLRRTDDRYRHRLPRPEDIFLLVEVSDTSLERDQEQKLPSYARAGIPEVWIVDLNEQVIFVYRQPNFAGYSLKTVLTQGQSASPLAFPDVLVDVAELLKR